MSFFDFILVCLPILITTIPLCAISYLISKASPYNITFRQLFVALLYINLIIVFVVIPVSYYILKGTVAE